MRLSYLEARLDTLLIAPNLLMHLHLHRNRRLFGEDPLRKLRGLYLALNRREQDMRLLVELMIFDQLPCPIKILLEATTNLN